MDNLRKVQDEIKQLQESIKQCRQKIKNSEDEQKCVLDSWEKNVNEYLNNANLEQTEQIKNLELQYIKDMEEMKRENKNVLIQTERNIKEVIRLEYEKELNSTSENYKNIRIKIMGSIDYYQTLKNEITSNVNFLRRELHSLDVLHDDVINEIEESDELKLLRKKFESLCQQFDKNVKNWKVKASELNEAKRKHCDEVIQLHKTYTNMRKCLDRLKYLAERVKVELSNVNTS